MHMRVYSAHEGARQLLRCLCEGMWHAPMHLKQGLAIIVWSRFCGCLNLLSLIIQFRRQGACSDRLDRTALVAFFR